jgi:MFS family permease
MGMSMSAEAAVSKRVEFTNKEKQMLLWASFLSLMAAGVGFVFRAMVPALWGKEFGVDDSQVGVLFGAGLWPIAIMMILFSFIVDKIGYKKSMFFAFAFQLLSVVLTFTAKGYNQMWWACICAGIGHGVVEAVINPLCVSVFRDEKTKAMNILHASWPAGMIVGGITFLTLYSKTSSWSGAKSAWIMMLLPILAYGVMFFLCKKFPVDERVEAKVPMSEMLKEFGGLGAFLAITFISYEIFSQLGLFGGGQYSRLGSSLLTGAIGGGIFGAAVKSTGRWIFFFLCVLMVPLATAEIATDGWIQNLMKPTMGEYAGWALVFSSVIMMLLRFCSGIPLKLVGSPLGLLMVSSVFSIIGLFWLSVANGALVFVAFIFYAVGQTYYWPSVLGFTSERFPKGGALTLNTVSAMGLLTVGIFGFPFLGAVQDHYNFKGAQETQPALVESIKARTTTDATGKPVPIYVQKNLFGVPYETLLPAAVLAQPELTAEGKKALDDKLAQSGRRTLRVASILPITMAIGYGLMLLWFRSQGGYKKIVLAEAAPAGAGGGH